VVAIGECGLDYFRDFSPREDQKKWFEAQLQTAVEIELPVFLHQRDAHKDFISILKRYIQKLPAAVVHCFTGTAEEMEESLEMGCYIGITGWICDERRGKNLQSIVKDIPLSKLMVETDAPFLLPRDLSPKPKSNRNVPANLPHVVRTIAKHMDRSFEEVAEASTRNAEGFFRF
jgi:TatD DNase family protein